MKKLSAEMTISQFENGYWYTDDLKKFAREMGVSSTSKLRKDELEELILYFLKTGKLKNQNVSGKNKYIKDLEIGLTLDLPITNYTSNKKTKSFIIHEGKKIVPELKLKSGVLYRLNRWRDEKLSTNSKITYRDLVIHFIKLNQTEEKFAKIPHGRYINFLSEFLANEKNASRSQAIKAWKELKSFAAPKIYSEWQKYK